MEHNDRRPLKQNPTLTKRAESCSVIHAYTNIDYYEKKHIKKKER